MIPVRTPRGHMLGTRWVRGQERQALDAFGEFREHPGVPLTEKRQIRYLRRLVAGLAGLLWAMAFPNWGVAGLAWIAPGLLLGTAAGASPREAFRCGYIAGVVHYLTGLHWLLHMPVPFYPILGWLALGLFLSLYPALWTWACWKLWPLGKAETDLPKPDQGWLGKLQALLQGVAWFDRLRWAFLCAAVWVTWEMVQARLFSGFPWNLLGASQQPMGLITQVAAETGVYGISFLVVWTSVSLLLSALMLLSSPGKKIGWQREMALPFLVVIVLSAKGYIQILLPSPPSRLVRIAMIQPGFSQTMIWNERESARRFETLLSMSREALKQNPDLLVWPEAGVPYPIRYDAETFDATTRLLKGSITWLCLGSDDIQIVTAADGRQSTNIHNSAFLLSPEGKLTQNYAKRQLVIFGEYVPLVKWLPFLKLFTPISGGFTPGEQRVAFELPRKDLRFSPLICFEDMFAGVVRDQAQEDVQFLLNLTNDGWFGQSAQQWQHTANASLRAIENGLPLVRCSNNGITCWVESKGRILDAGFPAPEGAYGKGIKVIDLPIPLQSGPRTFYRRNGDVFGWICVAWVCLRGPKAWRYRSPTAKSV